MILRVEVATAAHTGRPRGLFPATLGLPREALSLALRLIALADGRFPLELLLPAPLAVAAGPRRHLTGRHEQALGTQRIEQGAIVGNQQAHALETRESRRDCLTGRGINVVGGLVHNKQIGTLPERAGNLQALLLAAGQGFVTPRPIFFHAQIAPQGHRIAVVGDGEVVQGIGRGGRMLLAVDAEQARRHRTAIGGKPPAGDTGEGRLAAAVVAHKPRPTAGQRGRHVAQHGIGARRIGVGKMLKR